MGYLGTPSKEWWRAQLEKEIEAKEREDEAITEMLIREYESRHAEGSEQAVEKPDTSDEIVEDHGIPIDGSATELEIEERDTEEAEQTDEDTTDEGYESDAAIEADDSEENDAGLEADEVEGTDETGTDNFSGNFSDDMNSDFDDDSRTYDGYID